MNQVNYICATDMIIEDGDKICFIGDESLAINVIKFKDFDEAVTCNVGEYYRYNNEMYRCINSYLGVFNVDNFNMVATVIAKEINFTPSSTARFTIENRALILSRQNSYTLKDIAYLQFITGSCGCEVNFFGEY